MKHSSLLALLVPTLAVAGAEQLAYREVAELAAPDPGPNDNLGDAVAVSGDIVLAGAPLAGTPLGGTGVGYFFLRHRDGGSWPFQDRVFPADSELFDLFASQTAVAGDLAVLGSQFDDATPFEGSGSAYVFQRDGTGWLELAKLSNQAPGQSDHFGWSVGISGDTVVVGTPNDDDLGQDSGSASIFQRDSGGPGRWGRVTKLLAEDGREEDVFGWAVAIDGDLVAVAAAQRTVSTGPEGLAITGPGVVYLFERDAGGPDAWGQVARLTASDAVDGDAFGWSVAVRGDTVVGGGVFHDGGGVVNGGGAWVFERDAGGAGAWGEVAVLLPDDVASSDQFGQAVAVWGDQVFVGAYLDDDLGDASGAGYLFERHFGGVGSWGQAAKVLPASGGGSDSFGWSVAMEGTRLVGGSPGFDGVFGDEGRAYVFEAEIGGAAFGVGDSRVTCRNHTTGQSVTVPLAGDGAWSCEAEGFTAAPADRITQRLQGRATDRDLAGVMAGLSDRRAGCRNLTTGERAPIDLAGGTSWDCAGAGLRILPGDRVVVLLHGTAG